MSLARTSRLAVVSGVRFETLPLDPQEFFVLSRIEGRPTVGEVLGMSALPAAQTEQILAKLLDLGALEQVDAAPPQPRIRHSTQELRAQAQERRRRVLAQQLGHARAPETSASGSNGRSAASPEPAVAAPGQLEDDDPTHEQVLELAAPDDPRLDPSLGLSLDQQRLLLAIDDGRAELTPFQLLGIHPTDDLKQIRGAFQDASRRFHPDAHHGRALGRFGPLMSTLFAEAKSAYQDLQKPEVRRPFVAALEQERQRRNLIRQQREAARLAAEQLRERRERDQAKQRREARAAQRAERQRERMTSAAKSKVDEYLQAAVDAEAMENFARAANNYRLALQLAPEDESIRKRWEDTRGVARRRRAKDAFARACTYVEVGHADDAVALFVEAAEANPTLEHLAHAADAVRQQDPGKARDLAMAALRELSESERGDAPLRPNVVADLRMMLARAFFAAGQSSSAREQVLQVQKVRPKDPEARALLKSIKVT